MAGQNWQWDSVKFDVLWPTEGSYQNPEIKDNNRSCVIKVNSAHGSILLTGDIEKSAELQLLEDYSFDNHPIEGSSSTLQSDVLIGPHHGSKTSSSQPFLDAVNPDYILIPVGFKNRYSMPHSRVLQRYRERNIPIIETFKSGAISMRFGQKNSNKIPDEYRLQSQKYWNSHH